MRENELFFGRIVFAQKRSSNALAFVEAVRPPRESRKSKSESQPAKSFCPRSAFSVFKI